MAEAETIEHEGRLYPYPRVGDDVYVPTELFLSHGADDFVGGLCRISRIVDGSGESLLEQALFADALGVEVAERPGWVMNWCSLVDQQDELRAEYGDRRGYKQPDLRPEFNE